MKCRSADVEKPRRDFLSNVKAKPPVRIMTGSSIRTYDLSVAPCIKAPLLVLYFGTALALYQGTAFSFVFCHGLSLVSGHGFQFRILARH
jgi:hypothetical protein